MQWSVYGKSHKTVVSFHLDTEGFYQVLHCTSSLCWPTAAHWHTALTSSSSVRMTRLWWTWDKLQGRSEPPGHVVQRQQPLSERGEDKGETKEGERHRVPGCAHHGGPLVDQQHSVSTSSVDWEQPEPCPPPPFRLFTPPASPARPSVLQMIPSTCFTASSLCCHQGGDCGLSWPGPADSRTKDSFIHQEAQLSPCSAPCTHELPLQ